MLNPFSKPIDAAQLDKLVLAHVNTHTINHARTIGLALKPTLAAHPTYVLGITSALPGEGKSTLSRALADVLATDFAFNVALLDLHAERPGLFATGEQRTARHGLSDWARNECALEDAQITHDGWTAMPCGNVATSRDLLHALVRNETLPRLRQQFNVVLLDLPDLANPAGAALAALCDGVVLVARVGKTPIDVAQKALPMLQHTQVHGIVLNRYRPATPRVLRHLFA
jgi:Mrp family chromosome partitioning ATPase